MKRKMRKFRLGGGTDDMGGKAGYEESPPDFEAPKKKSFAEAFREARKAGDSTFTWQGKKYTTELKKEKEPSVNFATQGRNPTTDFEKEGRVSPKSGAIAAGVESDDMPSKAMRDQARAEVNRSMNRRDPARPGGPGVRKRNVEEKSERGRSTMDKVADFIRNTRMVGGAPSYMKDESGRIRTPARDAEKMRRGGSVKSSASRRADGIAKKGKTRGRFV